MDHAHPSYRKASAPRTKNIIPSPRNTSNKQWEQYEWLKKQIPDGLSNQEYERAVIRAAKTSGV